LEISNWDHAPAWDTQRKYNDNVFRNTLEIRVENGKLIVINELPIEDYLRGLAEISNGDNPEKVKSILVSARGYATYYSDPAHRKFPDKPYDGSDNPDEFQKYLGYGYEQRSPQITALIEATKGEILAYSGTIIKPWYFNESDGKTLSYREYCLLKNNNNSAVCGDVPYLQSVLDPGGVGHTRKGHGVGLSGIGASYLAENLNYDYREILTYYFQGIEVKKVW
jgi:stage II sporulation protein D